MTPDDITSVLKVAEIIHPDLPEGEAMIADRLKLFPEGCLVLERDGDIGGYAISHPIRHHQPPELDSLLGEMPVEADQFYIHDLAVLPGFRGCGLAKECIDRLLGLAVRKGFASACLVSVYGTSSFWGRFGFVVEVVGGELREKLRWYGEDAVFMVRKN